MRSIVKGDCGTVFCDEEPSDGAPRSKRRLLVRRVVALACIALATYFAFEFFQGWMAASAEGLVASPDWSDPADVYVWLRGRVLGFTWRLRATLTGALPAGDVGMIFKIATCAVTAAVFLRVPQRS